MGACGAAGVAGAFGGLKFFTGACGAAGVAGAFHELKSFIGARGAAGVAGAHPRPKRIGCGTPRPKRICLETLLGEAGAEPRAPRESAWRRSSPRDAFLPRPRFSWGAGFSRADVGRFSWGAGPGHWPARPP